MSTPPEDHNVLSSLQVTRPHPSDNPLLLVFLVGGVTASELRLIKEAASTHKPGSQVCPFIHPLPLRDGLVCV